MILAATAAILLGLAAFCLLALYLSERRRARLLLRGEGMRLTQIAEAERAALEADRQASRAGDRLDDERERERRLIRDRDTARAWNHKLREQLAEARQVAGLLGSPGSPHELVLRVALDLLGAEKGVLLAHDDGDDDGDLDLVAAKGFDGHAEHNPLVQDLARRTLAADETVRENHPAEDEAITNLVAIPIYMRDRFHGVIVAANKPGGFDEYDDDLLLALGDHASVALENTHLHQRLRDAYAATVRVLAEAIEAKDPFLRGHCDEVSNLVADVANELDLGPRKREELVFASLLHDIGKIGISERILVKPGALSDEERTIVQLHPEIGYRLVMQVPELAGIGPAILHHHERWDGGGYPTGLKGEAIPLEARLIAIADSFSAMISERPYGTRMSPTDACEELRRCAGTQFDPELVPLFCSHVERREGRLLQDTAVDRALDDPGLQQLREPDEPLLGARAFGATDSTTLLYSHRQLQEEAKARAAAAAVNGRPFAVAVLEATELEKINLGDGYAAGDATLRELAGKAEEIAASAGGIAARLSGSRVAILIPDVDEEAASSLVDDLMASARLRVSCASWQEGESGADVIKRARTG